MVRTNGLPLGPPRPPRADRGYVMIMLMLVVTVMAIGLLVAVPVWETQLRRESEAELIFRGRQYVEAVRRYQLKNPGRFPSTLEELEEDRYIRKLFRDPMSPTGEWNVVLLLGGGGMGGGQTAVRTSGPTPGEAPGGVPGPTASFGRGQTVQRVLVAPESALDSLPNPLILGVVSASTRRSVRVYNEQESYDKWLFFYGQDPKKLPEIVYWGKADDEDKGP